MGDGKPVFGGYHIVLKNVPGAESGVLFYSATTPSATLDAPKFLSWDGSPNGGVVTSAGGGRQATWSPVTLSRACDSNHELWDWFDSTNKEGVEKHKQDLELTVVDPTGQILHTWNLIAAHITQYSDSGHNAQTQEVLVSTVQIEYERAELHPG
jgi:phage tail-like protein